MLLEKRVGAKKDFPAVERTDLDEVLRSKDEEGLPNVIVGAELVDKISNGRKEQGPVQEDHGVEWVAPAIGEDVLEHRHKDRWVADECPPDTQGQGHVRRHLIGFWLRLEQLEFRYNLINSGNKSKEVSDCVDGDQ